MPDDKAIKETVKAQFLALEALADKESPGVLEVHRLFGTYEVAVEQLQRYLNVPQPEDGPVSSTGSQLLNELG